MKVKQLIKQLQDLDPELDVFIDDAISIHHVTHVKKTKVMVDKDRMFYWTTPYKLESVEFDRYNKKAMNTKFPQAVLISRWSQPKKNNK